MPVSKPSYENDVNLGAYRAEVDRLRAEAERLREALRAILAVNADDQPTPGEAETDMAQIAHDALNAR